MKPASITKSTSKMSVFLCLLAAAATLASAFQGGMPASSPAGATTPIEQQLREFAVLGSVLYIAAHPDDENPQLITYLSRGRNYRAAYLSVTRGDGGQKVMGPEFGEELGVIRTQELLAARHLRRVDHRRKLQQRHPGHLLHGLRRTHPGLGRQRLRWHGPAGRPLPDPGGTNR